MPANPETVTSHGAWSRYTPDPIPEGFFPTDMFASRDMDGEDWYAYQRAKPFTEGSIVMLAMKGTGSILTATHDPSRLFPQGCLLIEAIGGTGVPEDYIGKVYAGNGVFEDPPVPVPAVISDRQFFQKLALMGIIPEADALASNAAVIPGALMTLINQLPAEDQFAAKMLVSGATEFRRDHPLTATIGAAFGWTSEQIDNFFREAVTL